MQDSLISRKALLEDMKNSITENSDTFDWINLINRQPAAYDVDKVVEQMGELKQFRLNLADAMSEIQKYGPGRRYVCFEDVVKILKGGGVDE